MDTHYFAVLIGVGATTVNAYLAQEGIADRHRRGLFGDMSLKEAVQHYKKAVDKGLLKIMSKMGISVISSYRGGYNFEAIGLSRALVAEFFPGMQSRISGIGLNGIARKVLGLHQAAWDGDGDALPVGGIYKLRRRGEAHAFEGSLIHTSADRRRHRQLRDLSPLRRRRAPAEAGGAARPAGLPHRRHAAIAVDEVESIDRNPQAPGGARHLARARSARRRTRRCSIAMNRIGARSDSGEGGEDPARCHAARQRRQRQLRHQADRAPAASASPPST